MSKASSSRRLRPPYFFRGGKGIKGNEREKHGVRGLKKDEISRIARLVRTWLNHMLGESCGTWWPRLRMKLALRGKVPRFRFTITRFTTQFKAHRQKLRSGGNSREYSLIRSTSGTMPNTRATEWIIIRTIGVKRTPDVNGVAGARACTDWVLLRARAAMQPHSNLIKYRVLPGSQMAHCKSPPSTLIDLEPP
ncbi:hypothetical protein DFP72DRAFT_853323 [Ephemerocybe angulata]|uniref:Uncharacterized protein n=1 Tax=Ephemerocybe angulata TaxID=980116 RepID=A0A8H6HLM6_9AGAR|nr:hypothetical protein DFP72DRAFT_853323 [Tulosesus angulatus]